MDKGITFRVLRDKLATFSDEQLDMRVKWSAEDCGGVVRGVEVMDEDMIDPSGEGMEPISAYPAPAYDTSREPVVARKGQPILMVD